MYDPASFRITAGIVSITFRQLSPRAIIELAVKAGLQSIEWGTDVHVPPGDLKRAIEVRQMTSDAGLEAAAYGSYYHAGVHPIGDFDIVLAAAVELGAPVIRVWAGSKGSAQTPLEERAAITNDLRRICIKAASVNIRVALEYHGATLTDELNSAKSLLDSLAEYNLLTLWQPSGTGRFDAHMAELDQLGQYIANVHCFHWQDYNHRYSLADGAAQWKAYIGVLTKQNRPIGVLMEFVKDDSPEQFLADAAALRMWLGESAKE